MSIFKDIPIIYCTSCRERMPRIIHFQFWACSNKDCDNVGVLVLAGLRKNRYVVYPDGTEIKKRIELEKNTGMLFYNYEDTRVSSDAFVDCEEDTKEKEADGFGIPVKDGHKAV